MSSWYLDNINARYVKPLDYNIEIGGGLGALRGKVWRIGLMGDSAREFNVFALLSALERILCSASTTFAGSVNYSCRFTSRS